MLFSIVTRVVSSNLLCNLLHCQVLLLELLLLLFKVCDFCLSLLLLLLVQIVTRPRSAKHAPPEKDNRENEEEGNTTPPALSLVGAASFSVLAILATLMGNIDITFGESGTKLGTWDQLSALDVDDMSLR